MTYTDLGTLPDFEIEPSTAASLASWLLSRHDYLQRVAGRASFETPEIAALGFSITHDAKTSLERTIQTAGFLLQNALRAGITDPSVVLDLAKCYTVGGDHQSSLTLLNSVDLSAHEQESGHLRAENLFELGLKTDCLNEVARIRQEDRAELDLYSFAGFEEWADVAQPIEHLVTEEPPKSGKITYAFGGKAGQFDHHLLKRNQHWARMSDLNLAFGYLPERDGAIQLNPENVRDLEQRGSVTLFKNGMVSKRAGQTVVEQPVVFLNGASWHFNNYYHTLAQNFSRIGTFTTDERFKERLLAIPRFIQEWGITILTEAGIPRDRILILEGADSVVLKDVFVPSMDRVIGPDAAAAFRKAVGVPKDRQGNRRVFAKRLSSNKSNKRLLTNEDELVAIAEEMGFEIIDPVALGIRGQIELMRETAVFCGPNGAAFGNMIFAPEDTRMVCVSAKETVGSWYPDLAVACNQKFFWCLGSMQKEALASRLIPQVPYHVDPDDFRLAVTAALDSAQ